jgi:hypothetical protein
MCPILCPAVPKIVPLLFTAADHLMAFGGIYESARSPSLPRIIVDLKYQGMIRITPDASQPE